MNQDFGPRTEAAVRRSRWPGWIWAVPIAALVIVGWLGVRYFLHRGPEITIAFASAHGVEAVTPVQYRGLKVGSVQDVALSEDGTQVVATVHMDSAVEDLLREGTRFWIAGAEISLSHLSSLRTLVSGPSIRMDPGPGEPTRRFQGLGEPPPVEASAKGTRYVLDAERVGSLGPETPVSYLGLTVGAVDDVRLKDDGHGFRIGILVRAPYDRLVRDRTRFWKAGAVRLSMGAQGVEAQLTSAKALLTGMIAFETPVSTAAGKPSEEGHRFRLYDSQEAAETAPTGPAVEYRLRFDGAVGGVSIGAPVKLRGFTIGRVTGVRLNYDAARDVLETPVTIEIEPSRLHLGRGQGSGAGDPAAALNRALSEMIENGLRARLEQSPPLIGGRHVALEFIPTAEPASLAMDGSHREIPTAASGDIGGLTSSAQGVLSDIQRMNLPAIARDLRDTVHRVDALASSPALRQSLTHLDETLANLQQVTGSAKGKVGPAIDSLRRAADAAESAVASADRVMGGTPGAANSALPAALEEITAAARAVRVLASYLERHPEALLQGRGG